MTARQMSMGKRLRRIASALSLCSIFVFSACGEDVESSAEGCSLTASISFEGREYTATDQVDGVTKNNVRIGRRLGVGEAAASCAGDEGQRVQVFKVVGIPVLRAVFAKPAYGLVQRTHFDED